jgi:hypothetical protein
LKSLKSRKTSILIVFTAGLEPAVSWMRAVYTQNFQLGTACMRNKIPVARANNWHRIFPLQVIGVAVLFFAATTSADPKFQSNYNHASEAETLNNYNEVNERKCLNHSVSLGRQI